MARATRSSSRRRGDPAVLAERAALYHQAGRLGQAERLYRQLLARKPADGEILRRLGDLYARRGDWEMATHHLQQAVVRYRRTRPAQRADLCFELGNALCELGRHGDAIPAYEEALELAPDDAELHNNLANALLAAGRAADAVGHYRKALKGASREPGLWCNLGEALQQTGHAEDAAHCLGQALALSTRDPALSLRLAQRLQALGYHGAAAGGYRQVLQVDPDQGRAWYGLGLCLQCQGRFREADEALRQALRRQPDWIEAHAARLASGDYQPDETELARLESLAHQPGLTPEQRCRLHFGLGRIHDRQDRFDRAFLHFAQGNRLRAGQRSFDPAAHSDYIDSLIATLDDGFFRQRGDFGLADARPVFIVGMPRSGTTLVEQILSSHPQFYGAGEQDTLRQLVRELPARLDDRPFPECLQGLDTEVARDLARRYLDRLPRTALATRRIGDKLPGNYIRLGLIALLFPRARIIHCRRDPLDTCWSCYTQDFAHGHSYSHDLDHLGRVYCDYQRLMAHWRRVLPLPILEFDYE
ncbi:MAG: tetratricopeptide repeat protein, partial [Candidatus Competibacterales bacterium]|nr:tetratricopeptide repeat protein [Candidatus Competibacterales bacterium]